MVIANLLTFPNHNEFYNEALGGSKNGYKYLLDSNLSWGQNKQSAENYQSENPDKIVVTADEFVGRRKFYSEDVKSIYINHILNEKPIEQLGATHFIIDN